MTRYEYRSYRTGEHSLQSLISSHAREGWRLHTLLFIGEHFVHGDYLVIMEREVHDQDP